MENLKIITLEWAELSLAKRFDYAHNHDRGGVYVWGFTIDDTFIPYYVGISGKVISRIYEHVTSLLNGRYTIFHRESLPRFYDKTVKTDKVNGRIYDPEWPYAYKKFLDRRNELQVHIDQMVESFTFSFANIDSKLISNQDLKDVEKLCINQIGKDKLANEKSGNVSRISVQHIGNSAVTQLFRK